MEGLNITTLAIDYGEIPPVAIGYEVNGTVYNLQNFQELMTSLNPQGWYYKDRVFNLQGTDYTVAEIYVKNQPLRLMYPIKTQMDENTLNYLYPYMLSMDGLGINQEYRIYREQLKVEPIIELEKSKVGINDWLDDLNLYFTEEEINEYGNLDTLTENQLDVLESEFDRRRIQKNMENKIEYKLPEQLSNYSLTYNSAYMLTTVSSQDIEEINRVKHTQGLKAVMRDMLAIPRISASEEGEDVSYNFDNMSEILNQIVPSAGDNSAVGTTVSIFENTAKYVTGELIKQYGDIESFINAFLEMNEYDPLLYPFNVNIGGKEEQVYVVKRNDSLLGLKIDFTRVKNDAQVLFPLSIIDLLNSIGVGPDEFLGIVNLMIPLYYKDLGMNIEVEDIKFESNRPTIFNLIYIGMAEDDKNIHLFKNENDKYYYIVEDNLANLMIGSKYLLNGNNFQIGYQGKDVIVEPTEPVLNSEDTSQVFITATETYDNNGDLNISTIYPDYMKYMNFNNLDEVENTKNKSIMGKYDELLEENKSYADNLLGVDNYVKTQPNIQTPKEIAQDTPFIPSIPETGAVDLFAQQPQVQPQQPIKELEIEKSQSTQIVANKVTADPNPYDMTVFPGNIAQAYAMIMGSIDQDKLGYFKTEFVELLKKYGR